MSTNTNVNTSNKYINTLKVFGIKVVKENGKFNLKNSLYSENFDKQDLKALAILSSIYQDFPDNEITNNIKNLLANLNLRIKNTDKIKLKNLTSKYDFSFYYSDLKEQINYCNKLCKEKYTIEIIYLQNKKEICVKGSAKELVYTSKNVYLKFYNTINKETLNINLNSILSINVQPQKANSIEITSTVVYKLKNRLAITYKVKENEYTDGYDKDGNLIVINRNEPYEKLISRLLRYNKNCEIISPKNLREKMKQTIDKILENYNEE